MSDPYQLGSDIEWLRHNKEEAERELKRAKGRVGRLRLLCFLLLLALGWTIYKFSLKQPVAELWNFQSVSVPFLSGSD